MQGLDEPSLEAALKGQNPYPAVAAMYRSRRLRRGPASLRRETRAAVEGGVSRGPISGPR